MFFYTSYFGALRRLPKDFVPVAICGGMKFPWKGLRYTKLAPSLSIFSEWKASGDAERYTRRFKDEILARLDPYQVKDELTALVGGDAKASAVVLMCYEKPPRFCHRHLVAEWLGNVLEWRAE